MPDAVEEIFIRLANPNGIVSISPGLRGTSYPGSKDGRIKTLKGLNLFHKMLIFNPFRVDEFNGPIPRVGALRVAPTLG
jgi:hypothetical protein